MSNMIAKALCTVTFVLSLWSFTALVPTCDAATVKISGYVYLQYQKNHSGVLVEFQPGPAPAAYASTTTDADGHFEVTIQSPGGYGIGASKAGFETKGIATIFAYKDTALSPITLIKIPTLLTTGFQRSRTLQRAESPYIIRGAQVDCDSLTIEPGCRIFFEFPCQGCQPQLNVYSYINAVGTPDDSITMANGAIARFHGTSITLSYWQCLGGDIDCDPRPLKGMMSMRHSIIRGLDIPDSAMTISAEDCDLRFDGSDGYKEYIKGTIVRSSVFSYQADFVLSCSTTASTISAVTLFLQNGSVFEGCDLEGSVIALAGRIHGSTVTANKSATTAPGTSITNCAVTISPSPPEPGTWTLDARRVHADSNTFCGHGKWTFGDSSNVGANRFGCDCPPGYWGLGAYITGGTDCHDNIVTAGFVVSGGSVVRGNILSGGIQVYDGGTVANNLVVVSGGYGPGIQATTLSSVHHNDVWGTWPGFVAYQGIPILGQMVQLNTNGDSCDFYFNLKADPELMYSSPGSCDAVLASCGSPLIRAGDPVFGSRNIWLPDTTCSATDVRAIDFGVLPSDFTLQQNYPNPFNASTAFTFSIPKRGHVVIDVVNTLGQVIAFLVNRELSAGSYEVAWDGQGLNGATASSGVYFYRVTADNHAITRKMVLLK